MLGELDNDHVHLCLGDGCRGADGLGSTWNHEDQDCQYEKKYDCPLCDEAPTDWVRVEQ